jgi:hypothetical protein
MRKDSAVDSWHTTEIMIIETEYQLAVVSGGLRTLDKRFEIDCTTLAPSNTEIDRNEAGRIQVFQISAIYFGASATKPQSFFHI